MSLLMTISNMVFIIVMDLLHDSYNRFPLRDTVCHQALHLYHSISFQKHQKDNKKKLMQSIKVAAKKNCLMLQESQGK